jgi:hypothetical protein
LVKGVSEIFGQNDIFFIKNSEKSDLSTFKITTLFEMSNFSSINLSVNAMK